jgi:hypothetical protein
MSSIKLKATAPAPRASLTTELNALANGSYSAASAAIDNTSNLDLFDDLELTVTYGTNPTANAPVEIYLIPSTDGTNYADSTHPGPQSLRRLFLGAGHYKRAATDPARHAAASRQVQVRCEERIQGFAFPATGTVVKRTPYSHQVT